MMLDYRALLRTFQQRRRFYARKIIHVCLRKDVKIVNFMLRTCIKTNVNMTSCKNSRRFDGTDKVLKHQKHLNEGFLYAVCQSPFFKQFLQNFTKFIRKLKNMDGLCYFKSFIVFGPGPCKKS